VNRPDAFVSHTPFIHVGPLARTVEDAALFAEAVAGPHPRDPWSLPDDGTDYLGATIRGIDRHSVAFSPDLGSFPVTDAVAAVVEEAVDGFRDAGASVDRVAIDPDVPRERMEEVILSELGLTNVSVVESFADSGIDLLGDHRGDLPGDFVEMVERARETDVVDYKRSEFVRTAMYDAVQDVFEDHDILVTPTVAVPTIENADDGLTTGPEEIDGEPVEPLLGWSLGYPFNFTGHPAASVPAGRTDRGIPVGLQIVAPRHDDETLLAAAAAFERVRPWREIYEDV
jgi:amidase/aspartyl-tRNA(Asn)/glutamyl-tRNA(Gln) amidotransferase subunit A